MNQQTKAKVFTFLYVFLIVSLILFMLWIVFWLKGDGKECVANPILYFENTLEGSQCTCYDSNFNQITVGNEGNEEYTSGNNFKLDTN